jgi:hypothetical protein
MRMLSTSTVKERAARIITMDTRRGIVTSWHAPIDLRDPRQNTNGVIRTWSLHQSVSDANNDNNIRFARGPQSPVQVIWNGSRYWGALCGIHTISTLTLRVVDILSLRTLPWSFKYDLSYNHGFPRVRTLTCDSSTIAILDSKSIELIDFAI